ncbi:MAG: tetratricopeptide repeat protein [Alphaproteobacteria bacterium]|nr:tetratricopeptide repeat protein [Alphaproteobacteria bacterium]
MTEHNLFQEIQEDLERQRYEALWQRYGIWVIAAALVAVIGTAGTNAYQAWQSGHNEKVTSGYIDAAKPGKDTAESIAKLESFAASQSGATQADFALLRAGALAAQKDDATTAVKLFDQVASDTRADSAFRQLGDLLSVRMQMDKGDAATLIARLQPLTAPDAPWRYSALEDQGYLALRVGDTAKARGVFTTISQDSAAPSAIQARSTDILRSLN